MSKDTRTAWGQEFDAKRDAWNEINVLKNRIAELEKERDALQAFVIKRLPSISTAASFSNIAKSIEGEVKSLLAKRDLEQQANGVSRFAKLHLGEHSLYSSFAKNYCSVILMQAKQLRAEVK